MYQSRHFGDVLETFWGHLETFGDLIELNISGLNHPIYTNHSNSTWRCSHYSLFIMVHGCTCYLFHKKKLQDHFVMQVKDMGSTN